MNKGIWAGLVAIAFVAGSITTGTIANAAPGGVSGSPIAALQLQVSALQATVDSFFDVFVDVAELEAEEAARIAADTSLQQQIEAEATARAAADSALEAALEAEVEAQSEARVAADDALEAALEVEVEQLQLNIRGEAAATQAADEQLQLNILAEAAARQAADSQLQIRVNGVCPIGQSIRAVNSDGTVVCEVDDGETGSIGRLQVIERVDPTPGDLPGGGAVASSFAPCLTGEIVVGGGYRVSPATVNVFSEQSAFSEGAFGWFVNAYYESGTTPGSVTAIANCATIVP